MKCNSLPSVPKFKTKYREPLAEAAAYSPVATLKTQFVAARLGAYRPIPRTRNANPYRAKGIETTYKALIRRKRYHQTIVATM
jgi:hypothetical protein